MFGSKTDKQRQATQIVRQSIDKMIGKDPFFGHLMDQLRLAPDSRKDIPTIGTNGRLLVYDSDWVINTHKAEGPDKFATIMAHEAAHIAFGHPYRLGDKDPDRYDKACDAVVNGILRKKGYEMPSGSFMYPGAENMTVEECYRLLVSQSGTGEDEEGKPKRTPQAGGKCFSPDEGTDKEEEAKARGEQPGEGEGEQDAEDEVRENVAKAAQKARKEGRMPGDYQTMIDQSFHSKKDWKDLLRLVLGGGELKQPSWSRPNRRFVHENMYLPGAAKHGPGEIVLAVDVSGSIDRPLLEKFLTEVRKINIDMQPEAIHVMTCDTQIPWCESFGPYDDVMVPPRAITQGGTRFSPVFERVKKEGWRPKALVYFTDLECSDFGQKPDYPVYWVAWPGSRDRAPWGEVIKMDD